MKTPHLNLNHVLNLEELKSKWFVRLVNVLMLNSICTISQREVLVFSEVENRESEWKFKHSPNCLARMIRCLSILSRFSWAFWVVIRTQSENVEETFHSNSIFEGTEMGFLHSLLLTGYGWREENDFRSHFKPTETVTTVVGCLLWARWHFTYSSEGMNHHFQFRPVRSHPPAIVVIFVAVCSRQNSIPIHLRSVLAWKTIIFTDFSISFHPISSCSCSFVGMFHDVDVSVSVERCLLNSQPYESSVSSHISMDCWLLRIQFEFERSASHSVLTWFTICVDFGLVFSVSRVFSEFEFADARVSIHKLLSFVQ